MPEPTEEIVATPGAEPSAAPPAVPVDPAPVAPVTFDAEYVAKLRDEAANHRLKAKESAERARQAEEAATKAREAAEAEAKRIQDEYEAKLNDALALADNRGKVLEAELERKLGVIPEEKRGFTATALWQSSSVEQRLDFLAALASTGAISAPAPNPAQPAPALRAVVSDGPQTYADWARMETNRAADWKRNNPEAWDRLRREHYRSA